MDTQHLRPQGTSQVTLVSCHKKTFFFYSQAYIVPCSLVKDSAVNELPSSGFVPETNDKKTPKKSSVRISFSVSNFTQ